MRGKKTIETVIVYAQYDPIVQSLNGRVTTPSFHLARQLYNRHDCNDTTVNDPLVAIAGSSDDIVGEP